MDLEAFELVILRRPKDARSYDEETLDRIQREHLAYLESLRAAGQIVTNGPVLDQPDESMRGLAFYRTGSLGDINPPEEIDGPHGVLADSLDEIADVIGQAADRADDGDFLGAMSVLEGASDDLAEDVEHAIAEIRTAGYYIGDNDDWS